jgi:hypothetical protein
MNAPTVVPSTRSAMRKTSIPLKNLRGTLILLILAFHSFSAYIVTQPAHPPPFDSPPYDWRAFPIIDSARWIGFDLFCAFQFLYLMQLMFFLSGLFVWPSLQRKGWTAFVLHRIVRLGVPFVIGIYLLMPVAFYPVYRVTAVDPSWSAFWSHWQALPLTPTGPMWFLWFLVLLDFVAVILHKMVARANPALTVLLAECMARPGRFFLGVVVVTAIAYLPLSALFEPWQWIGFGPFEVQAAFAPQYVIYFLLGLAVGAHGYDRGLLDSDGPLVRRWPLWATGSVAAFALWMIPTALIVKEPTLPIAILHVVGDLGLVIFAAAACLTFAAIFVRFAGARWPMIDSISEHAYGIYFFHYVFVLWLQYVLLGLALPAVAKGVLVLIVTVIGSWMASVLTSRVVASGRGLLGREATVPRAPDRT